MSQTADVLPLSETVEPADEAAVADVVRDAAASGTPVYPIGGGTSLDYGVRPEAPGIGLLLAKLNHVVDYPVRDLTITVEAGLTVAALARRLKTEKQRLPVDVPQAGCATVGGVVATALAGPRQYGWGTIRDYVLGMRAVDGRGTAFASGGRVVKNAAGYNLCRLLAGSLGTLGIVTQVTLMVKPMPETSAFVACEVPEFETAQRLLAGLVDTDTLPAAIEFLLGPHWQEDPALPPLSKSGVGRLAVGFEGTHAEVDWMAGQLRERWRRATGHVPETIRGSQASRLWDRLTEFPVREASADDPSSLIAQIGVLPSAAVGLIELLRQIDRGCSVQSHAGNGTIRVRFSPERAEAVTAPESRVRSAVSAAGGSMVVLSHSADSPLDREAIWGRDGQMPRVVREIKRRFDPKHVLNPGRYIFEGP